MVRQPKVSAVTLGEGKTLRERVVSFLRAEIARGRWQSGAQLPTVRELSAELGLSTSPVSQAFTQLVREGYLEQHVGRGTFLRSAAPQDRQRTGTAGIVFSGALPGNKSTASEVFDRELMLAITLRLNAQGLRVQLFHEDALQLEGRRSAQLAAASPLRGIDALMNIGPVSDSLYAQARTLDIPLICLGDPSPPADVPFVAGGIQQAVWEGLDILHRAGHRDIALAHTATGLPPRTRRLRYDAFFSGCAELGITPREQWVVDAGPRFRIDVLRLRELLHSTPRPTAILCTHNHVAQAIYEVAALTDVNIPQHLSVLLITSHADFGEDFAPPLSTLLIPMDRYADKAVTLLLHMLEDRQTLGNGGDLIRPVRRLRDSIALPRPETPSLHTSAAAPHRTRAAKASAELLPKQ